MRSNPALRATLTSFNRAIAVPSPAFETSEVDPPNAVVVVTDPDVVEVVDPPSGSVVAPLPPSVVELPAGSVVEALEFVELFESELQPDEPMTRIAARRTPTPERTADR